MTIHAQLSRLQAIMKLPPSETLMDEVDEICSAEPASKLFWCERLENVKWFSLLVKRKWFSNPPSITREGEMIIHPAWPESVLLLRFAKRIPTAVAKALAVIPQSK